MRTLLVVATVAGLTVSATAAERQQVRSLIRSLPAFAGIAAWDLMDCTRAQAKELATRPEPKVTDADWRPNHARATVEQESAQVLAQCEIEASILAAAVDARTMAKLKAAIRRDAAETLQMERRFASQPILIAPQPRR